jgi:hypothetical protein
MSFNRRSARLERLFSEPGLAKIGRREQQQWRQLFTSIMSAMEESDIDEATRSVVEERYSHLPPEERDELASQLLETFAWWAVVNMEDVRRDRRNIIPPALRSEAPGGSIAE